MNVEVRSERNDAEGADKRQRVVDTKSIVRPGYLRQADAARYMGISVRTLSDWMRRHIVSYSKVTHRVCLFKQADLDAMIERVKIKAIGEAM
jgi:hypothetical protein